ncbi:hypothetical protein MKX03_007118, partial [Papaver bracteatum]
NKTKKTFYDPIDFDAIDLTEDLVVDDDPDQINIDDLEAIDTDIKIPIFESANRRNHDLPQARA